ncbi:MAG TPA: V-type ATP synthase subunit D [bacterium]|nr:V-type ATP synthase subunit D [bacterium]
MATRLNVNPTKQELLKLKLKLKTAQRGHKLLKEKRDGLLKHFMAVIKQARDLRNNVEQDLAKGFRSYLVAAAQMNPEFLENALLGSERKVSLRANIKNVMSVNIPEFAYEESGDFLSYSATFTSASLDQAISSFANNLKDIVSLAQIEHSAKLLAAEIEKTRRRVNALEYVSIPNIMETIKYIQSKLNEQERGTLITLMKVKAKLEAEAREAV